MGKNRWHYDAVCTPENQCVVAEERKFSFQIEAKMRTGTAVGKKVGSLWMRGSGPGLSWDKPIELRRSGSAVDSWRTKIQYRSSSDALPCTSKDYCWYNQRAVEFRLYRDQQGKDDMLGPNFYFQLPVSESMEGAPSFLTPTLTVYPWFDGREVLTREFEVTSSLHSIGILDQTFKATLNVLYPPSFEHNIRKRYPLVLYFGYSAQAFAPLLELAFVREALTREAVVVGVTPLGLKPPYILLSPYPNTGMWYCKKSPCDTRRCATCWLPRKRDDACDKKEFAHQAKNCMYFKVNQGYGDMFLDFIEMDVVPKISEVTQERVDVDFPRHRLTLFGEFDATSLLACHAAVTRPHIYQNAACFSAPVYWPMSSKNNPRESYLRNRRVRAFSEKYETTPALRVAHLTQKYYIDISANQEAEFPLVDPYKHTDEFVEELKNTFSLEEGKNILYFTIPDIAMAYVMRESGSKATMMIYDRFLPALRFFLLAEGGPNRESARTRAVPDKVIAENSELYGGLVQGGNGSLAADDESCDAHCDMPGVSRPTEVPILFFLPILGESVETESLCLSDCLWLLQV